MSLVVLGISYKTAPIDVREAVAIRDEMLPKAIQDFCKRNQRREVLILSTCNRLEIYATHLPQHICLNWLAHFHGLSIQNLKPHAYYHTGLDALSHAMNVTSSLDSMILGEPQIFGQMKQAYCASQKQHAIRTELSLAFKHIFAAAKSVRTQTKVGACPVSVAFHAARLAQQKSELYERFNALLIGTGDTMQLLARHLKSLGCDKMGIVGRNIVKADALARAFDGESYSLTELKDIIHRFDIIISATDSPKPIVTLDMVQTDRFKFRPAPALFIDMAVPRDIDPQIATLPYAWLSNIDDLQSSISRNTQARKKAAEEARNIISKHQFIYLQDIKARDSSDAIKHIRQKVESLKEKELDNCMRMLSNGKDPEAVLNLLANRLTNKWLHRPCVNLREAGIGGQEELLQAAMALFEE